MIEDQKRNPRLLDYDELRSDNTGMFSSITLRDLFAAAALCGQLANGSLTEAKAGKMVSWSYRYADAMLAERAKDGDE